MWICAFPPQRLIEISWAWVLFDSYFGSNVWREESWLRRPKLFKTPTDNINTGVKLSNSDWNWNVERLWSFKHTIGVIKSTATPRNCTTPPRLYKDNSGFINPQRENTTTDRRFMRNPYKNVTIRVQRDQWSWRWQSFWRIRPSFAQRTRMDSMVLCVVNLVLPTTNIGMRNIMRLPWGYNTLLEVTENAREHPPLDRRRSFGAFPLAVPPLRQWCRNRRRSSYKLSSRTYDSNLVWSSIKCTLQYIMSRVLYSSNSRFL